MRIFIPFFITCICVFSLLSCDENAVRPLYNAIPDSTSQDFTFEVTFIESDISTVLWSVCVINDTCVWVAGRIVHQGDGRRIIYNAAQWNGKEWKLHRIMNSLPEYGAPNSYEMYEVVGTSPDNVWFASVGRFSHWDGREFTTHYNLAKEIVHRQHSSWIGGPDNIWVGGSNGTLAHFNGRIWRRIRTDFDWEISSIWGNRDTVLLAAVHPVSGLETRFYTVVNERVQLLMPETSLDDSNAVVAVGAVWFDHLNNINAEGAWFYRYDGQSWSSFTDRPTSGMAIDMYGAHRNDIVVCGHKGAIRHWNGKRWRIWRGQPGADGGWLHSIQLRDNTIWAVGSDGTGKRSVIIKGTRPG